MSVPALQIAAMSGTAAVARGALDDTLLASVLLQAMTRVTARLGDACAILMAESGLVGDLQRWPAEYSTLDELLGGVVRSARPLRKEDWGILFDDLPLADLMILPIHGRQHTLGAVALWRSAGGASYSISERGHADDLVELIGLQIERVPDLRSRLVADEERIRLLDSERHARERLAILAQSSRMFAEVGFDEQAVMDRVALTLAGLLGGSATIRLQSADGERLELRATHHGQLKARVLFQKHGVDEKEDVAEEIAQQSMRRGRVSSQPLWTRDLLPSTEAGLEAAVQGPVSQQATAPLRWRNDLRGLVSVTRFFDDRPFTVDDLVLLEELADRASMAIDNALLFRAAEQARAAAENAKERLESLFMQAPALVTIHRGPEHVYEFANLLAQETFGSVPYLGRRPLDVLPELEKVYPFVQEVIDTATPLKVDEVPLTELVGDIPLAHDRYMTCIIQPLFDASFQPEGVMFFGYDVTEQVRSRRREREAILAREEAAAILDAVYASSPMGMAFVDRELRYVRVNRTLAALNRRSIEAHIGLTILEVVPDHGAHLAAMLRRALAGETITGQEFTAPLANGNGALGHWMISYFPVRQGDEVIGAGCAVVDITERRRAEEERARLLAEAQAAIRLRDDFLSVAGHELRTPLTALKLNVEAISRQRADQMRTSQGTEKVHQRARSAGQLIRRLTTLIDGLLDVSRLTAGRLSLHRERMDLTDLCIEVVERFRDEAERFECRLSAEIEPNVEGIWDEVRIDQILTNLLSNAIKYGPSQPIEVKLRQTATYAEVAVTDHGLGIAPQDQERIFGRFERAVSERNYGGLGIGLWVVKELVEAHQGTVTVSSAPGEGSTFLVRLPFK